MANFEDLLLDSSEQDEVHEQKVFTDVIAQLYQNFDFVVIVTNLKQGIVPKQEMVLDCFKSLNNLQDCFCDRRELAKLAITEIIENVGFENALSAERVLTRSVTLWLSE